MTVESYLREFQLYLEDQFAHDEIESALLLLFDASKPLFDQTANLLLHLRARLTRATKQYRTNLISLQDFSIERSRILHGARTTAQEFWAAFQAHPALQERLAHPLPDFIDPLSKEAQDLTALFRWATAATESPSGLPIKGPFLSIWYVEEDREYAEALKKALALLVHQGLFQLKDFYLLALEDHSYESLLPLAQEARLVMPLLSHHFLYQHYGRAERWLAEQCLFAPVLVRSTDLGGTFFETIKRLPANGRPISEWPQPDAAYAEISRALKQVFATTS